MVFSLINLNLLNDSLPNTNSIVQSGNFYKNLTSIASGSRRNSAKHSSNIAMKCTVLSSGLMLMSSFIGFGLAISFRSTDIKLCNLLSVMENIKNTCKYAVTIYN